MCLLAQFIGTEYIVSHKYILELNQIYNRTEK